MTYLWLISCIVPIFTVGFLILRIYDPTVKKFLLITRCCYSCHKDMYRTTEEWMNLGIDELGVPRKCKSCARIDKCYMAIGNLRYLISDIKLFLLKFSLGIGNLRKKFVFLNLVVIIVCFCLFVFNIKFPLYLSNIIFPLHFFIDVWAGRILKSMNSNLGWQY